MSATTTRVPGFDHRVEILDRTVEFIDGEFPLGLGVFVLGGDAVATDPEGGRLQCHRRRMVKDVAERLDVRPVRSELIDGGSKRVGGLRSIEGTRGFKEPLAEHDVQVPVVDPRSRRHAIDETPHRGRLDWLDDAGIAETAAPDVFVRGVAVAVDGGHRHIVPDRELFSLLRCVATKALTGMQLCRIRL